MSVRIFEVGPRDGLQNESKNLSIDARFEFIKRLVEAGHSDIEIGAFVSPKWIPQMEGSLSLIKKVLAAYIDGPRFWALVPNAKGFEDSLESGIKNIAVFTAASETFNLKNINTSIDGSFERFNEFLPQAKKAKMRIRGYVSTCFGCPYEGKVEERAVLKVAERLLKLGVHEISIGDTIGVANPKQVNALVKKLLKLVGPKKLALHFHDTRGLALTNIYESLEQGVNMFDSSAGGLGGCPYAPGAAGNVATDDLVYMLREMKIKTGIDLDRQVGASKFIQSEVDRELPSRFLKSRP
ncbi:MAG: hydroxymethylglutaryl-CoA lyase [Oligoflexia bacterium]|nr:hydroxymethylglutaryl-CoA lyase [Oligoflexia bacterium]